MVPTPNASASESLLGVAAISANDVWAVGASDNYVSGKLLAIHWDGQEWNLVSNMSLTGKGGLRGITAAKNKEILMVGDVNGRAIVARFAKSNCR
jgi:hypothetical protein